MDSLAPISSDTFLFTRNTTYPNVLQGFEQSFAAIRALPCDILLTPHTEASGLWDLVAGYAASTRNIVCSSTLAPFAQSDQRVNSFGEWLTPPTLGTKIIPIGASLARNCAS